VDLMPGHNSIPGWGKLRAEMLAAHPDCECGQPAAELGHIVPRAAGGIDGRPNLLTQCSRCNNDLLHADRRAGGSVAAALTRRFDDVNQVDAARWAHLAAHTEAAGGIEVLLGKAPAKEGSQGPEKDSTRTQPTAPAAEQWSPRSAVIKSRSPWR
jgi:hypothetical protein